VCTTTEGVDLRELGEAVSSVSRGGARVVVVVAPASEWREGPSDDATVSDLGSAATLKVLRRQEELARCLAS